MNFLEAHRLVSEFVGGPELRFLFATSGTPDKLTLFLRAEGARVGRSVSARTLPFNTLGQTLLAPPVAGVGSRAGGRLALRPSFGRA